MSTPTDTLLEVMDRLRDRLRDLKEMDQARPLLIETLTLLDVPELAVPIRESQPAAPVLEVALRQMEEAIAGLQGRGLLAEWLDTDDGFAFTVSAQRWESEFAVQYEEFYEQTREMLRVVKEKGLGARFALFPHLLN